jgi:hypothetical protein
MTSKKSKFTNILLFIFLFSYINTLNSAEQAKTEEKNLKALVVEHKKKLIIAAAVISTLLISGGLFYGYKKGLFSKTTPIPYEHIIEEKEKVKKLVPDEIKDIADILADRLVENKEVNRSGAIFGSSVADPIKQLFKTKNGTAKTHWMGTNPDSTSVKYQITYTKTNNPIPTKFTITVDRFGNVEKIQSPSKYRKELEEIEKQTMEMLKASKK